MSFIGRFNKFMCNKCKVIVYVSAFPEGWIYVTPKMDKIEHYCKECEEKREKKNGR